MGGKTEQKKTKIDITTLQSELGSEFTVRDTFFYPNFNSHVFTILTFIKCVLTEEITTRSHFYTKCKRSLLLQ